MSTVLNINNPRNSTNPIFFGQPKGIVGFVDMKYPVFKRIYLNQLSFFWTPFEISMISDHSSIKTLTDTERFIFENNLYFQTVGDSFLGDGIMGILQHVTNNELYASLFVHANQEANIHGPSYFYAIENIYNEPDKVFYSILENPAILERAKNSTEKFDVLLNSQDDDKRKHLVNTIICLLSLESISFYNSFLTSFYFHKNGKMTGVGSIIKLISRDEHEHKSNCINILKILLKEECEGFLDLKDYIIETIRFSFTEMASQEHQWIDYLMSRGELPGLSSDGLKRYVKYLTNRVVKDLGLQKEIKIFEETKNPFPWVASYLGSSKNTHVLPQEAEIVNYVKSSKNDLDDFKF